MDRNELTERIGGFFSKYKYVLLILGVGLALMSIPDSKRETKPEEIPVAQQQDLSQELEQILEQMQGVGKVKVLLTQGTGSETQYQTDREQSADGSLRVETVIVSTQDREEQGLIKTVTPPTYLGAIVVCQGAEQPRVQLAVTQAVANVTGISTDRITVVKMK